MYAETIDVAIEKAAGAVNSKQEFASVEDALASLKERSKFDPSAAQLLVGMCLNFDRTKMKCKISDIGTNGASVVTVPAGMKKADGSVVYDRAINFYLSTPGKTIRVTDANGEPVQDETGAQRTVTGQGNPIWEACDRAKNDAEVLNVFLDKQVEIVDMKRDFGPSQYVTVGETRVPKGHKLTSLPLFKELVG